MDDNSFSLLVNNGIISKEESVAYLRVVRARTVRVYKTLTLEEAITKRLTKGKNKGRQSLLVNLPQEHNFQQQHPFLPVQSHSLAQQQHQLAIQKQPHLSIYNNFN